jgi:GntR family transcriptional regulator of vanillate catabolism
LWRLSKSPVLIRALEQVSALPFAEPGAMVFGGSADAQQFHAGNAVVAIEQHAAISDAIGNREGTRAESIAREHSRLVRKNLDWALRNRELVHFPGASLITAPRAQGSEAAARTARRTTRSH